MCWVHLLRCTAFPVAQHTVPGALGAACWACPLISDPPFGCQMNCSLDWVATCKARDRDSMPGDNMACHAELTWTFSGVRPAPSSSFHPGCFQSTFSVLPAHSRCRCIVL